MNIKIKLQNSTIRNGLIDLIGMNQNENERNDRFQAFKMETKNQTERLCFDFLFSSIEATG